MWNAPVTPKVKHFMWRIFKASLPTKSVMVRRHIGDDESCPVCEREAETIEHALLKCSQARRIWGAVEELNFINFHNDMSWNEFMHLIAKRDVMIRSLALTLAWLLWRRRNQIVFDNRQKPDMAWIGHLRAIVAVLAEKRDGGSAMQSCDVGSDRWSPPPRGWLKFNVDAGLRDAAMSGLGVIGRDEHGGVWAVAAKKRISDGPALLSEMMAIEEGLLLARSLGVKKVILESDCLLAIQALRGRQTYRNQMGVILQNIRCLAESFREVRWSHVKHSGNSVAHSLVALACNGRDLWCWNFAQLCISSIIRSEIDVSDSNFASVS